MDEFSPKVGIRSLILDRLPIFICAYGHHDATLLEHMQSEYEQLKGEGNFIVRYFKKLTVKWKLLPIPKGQRDMDNEQRQVERRNEIFATLKRSGSGTDTNSSSGIPHAPIELWVAGTDKNIMYE